jgi:hypothetical protein
VGKLQAAYGLEKGETRTTDKEQLASLYRTGAAIAANNPNVDTWGKLFDVLAANARTLGVAGQIPATQKALQAHLHGLLPTDPGQAMTPAGRRLASETFLRIASDLDRVR